MSDTSLLTVNDAEGRLLAEGIAEACSNAFGGMRVQAVYIAEANGFLVQLAIQAAPETYH